MSLRKKRKCIILKGFKLLKEEQCSYSQKAIANKLDFLGYTVSLPLLSNLYHQKPVSDPYLEKVANGFCEIIAQELCLEFQTKENPRTVEDWGNFVKINGTCEAKRVPETTIIETPTNPEKSPFIFHQKGRFFINEKVDFIRHAKKEVYEIGVRLRRFSAYFTERSDEEFRTHIESLLAKGIDFNCFLLNPDSNAARLYSEDRAKTLEKEKYNPQIIKEVIQELLTLRQEFKKAGYPGQLKVHSYSLIPNNSFFAVDPFSSQAKMAVSHYLHGSLRSKCPLLEFSKKNNPKLYALYFKAFQVVLNHSRELS